MVRTESSPIVRLSTSDIAPAENRVLGMLAHGDPLAAVLNDLCRTVEAIVADSFVSIMLLNRDENRLWYAARGSLPSGYTETFNGLPVGPAQASCGAAAYRNEPVIVPDVALDPKCLNE